MENTPHTENTTIKNESFKKTRSFFVSKKNKIISFKNSFLKKNPYHYLYGIAEFNKSEECGKAWVEKCEHANENLDITVVISLLLSAILGLAGILFSHHFPFIMGVIMMLTTISGIRMQFWLDKQIDKATI